MVIAWPFEGGGLMLDEEHFSVSWIGLTLLAVGRCDAAFIWVPEGLTVINVLSFFLI